jgi:hypothetical protein
MFVMRGTAAKKKTNVVASRVLSARLGLVNSGQMTLTQVSKSA